MASIVELPNGAKVKTLVRYSEEKLPQASHHPAPQFAKGDFSNEDIRKVKMAQVRRFQKYKEPRRTIGIEFEVIDQSGDYVGTLHGKSHYNPQDEMPFSREYGVKKAMQRAFQADIDGLIPKNLRWYVVESLFPGLPEPKVKPESKDGTPALTKKQKKKLKKKSEQPTEALTGVR